MGLSISFRCSICNARIKASAKLVGSTRPCPRCGQDLVVPTQSPEDAGPMLLINDGSGHSRPRR